MSIEELCAGGDGAWGRVNWVVNLLVPKRALSLLCMSALSQCAAKQANKASERAALLRCLEGERCAICSRGMWGELRQARAGQYSGGASTSWGLIAPVFAPVLQFSKTFSLRWLAARDSRRRAARAATRRKAREPRAAVSSQAVRVSQEPKRAPARMKHN